MAERSGQGLEGHVECLVGDRTWRCCPCTVCVRCDTVCQHHSTCECHPAEPRCDRGCKHVYSARDRSRRNSTEQLRQCPSGCDSHDWTSSVLLHHISPHF